MRLFALTKRIMKQILHDKRTLALILIAPILVLSLIYFILNSEDNNLSIGVINASDNFITELKNNDDYNITIKYIKKDQVSKIMKEDKIDGAINEIDNEVSIYLNGSDSSVATKVEMLIKNSFSTVQQKTLNDTLSKIPNISLGIPKTSFNIDYIIGNENGTLFDKFGIQLIGIIVYFFVFLIAGIQFLSERTSGTLEKLFSTPIRKWEIVTGYILGFSLIAILQTTLITFFVVYVLGLSITGSIWYVLLINLLTAINALSLGILLSGIANSEFQMVQFIPIVILPQVFLCGLFRVSGIWGKLGYITPLHYTSNAMIEIAMKGNGLSAIWTDLLVLLLSSMLFILINILLLNKKSK